MLAITIISVGEHSELNPDNQNSCVSSCSQTDVEQFSAETSRHGVEPSRQEQPTGTVENGSRTLVEMSQCEVGKNDANTSSSPDRCVGGDGVGSTDSIQNFEGLGKNEDSSSREIGAITLSNRSKNFAELIQMDVDNPPGEVLTTSTECGETLFEGCKDQVQMDAENSSVEVLTTSAECSETFFEGCKDRVEMDAENPSEEVLTTSAECSETLFEGCENQVEMDVEDTFREIQNVFTDLGENLSSSFAVPVEINVENSAGEVVTSVSECSGISHKLVEMNVEKIAGEVQTTVTRSEDVCNSCEDQSQTDENSSLSEEQTTSPECVEKLLKSCEGEVQMDVEITSEKETTSTDCCANLSESHENEVLVNAVSCVNERLSPSKRSEKSLSGCEDTLQINVESSSFPESSKYSLEFDLERVENTSYDANILADVKKNPSKHSEDTWMNLSVTNDLALLALDDSSSVKVQGSIESIDPKDLLPSCDHIPEVQYSDTSAGLPKACLENSGNASFDMEVDLSLVSYNMLSQILEEEDIDGIFRSTLSSQESDTHSDTSDSDRLVMDLDEPPKRAEISSGSLPNEKETSPVEQFKENNQTSFSGDRVERLKVTSERLNPKDLSANLVGIDECSTTPGKCDNATGGEPVVTEKVDEPHVPEKNVSVSSKNKAGELLHSEPESKAKTEGGSGTNKADDLEENGKDGVKLDPDVKKESGGMSNKVVFRNGVLFVPSRMVVKREVPVKPEVKINPTPDFDVGSVWQVIKKQAMGMNAKPDM